VDINEISDSVTRELRSLTWDYLLHRHSLIENWLSAEWYLTKKYDSMYGIIAQIVDRDKPYQEMRSDALSKQKFFGPSLQMVWMKKDEEYKTVLKVLKNQFISELLPLIKSASVSENPKDWRLLANNCWQPLARYPKIGNKDISPRDAEHYCGEFLKYMGAEGVEVTKASKDGGLDVISSKFVGQVKHLHSKVGVKAMRELLGASLMTGKQSIMFSKSGFTQEALDFAIANQILLYSYAPRFEPETLFTVVYDAAGLASTLEHTDWMGLSINNIHSYYVPEQYKNHWLGYHNGGLYEHWNLNNSNPD
jgi:HJR/Mrr/RecB family endonuclease